MKKAISCLLVVTFTAVIILQHAEFSYANPISLPITSAFTTDYTYNPQTLRLSSLHTQNAALQTLQDFSYQFDRVGNVRSIQDNIHTATQSFAYDDLNRLTSAIGSYGSFGYQYDAIGNLTNKEGVLQSYGVAGSKPHAITSASTGMTFEYDTNGNMTTKKKNGVLDQTLRYDIENRLTEVVNENIPATASLTYTLSPGWNFISFPTLPTNKSISSVLSSLTFNTDYIQVSRYNATTLKFENYVNDSQFNDFTTLEEGRGYEIYVTNPAGASFTLQVNPLTVNQSLKTSYNLIGAPGTRSLSKQEALNNLIQGTDYDSLKTWNGTAFVEATTLEPSKSYFIRMLRAATWTPPKTPKTTRFTYDGDGGRVKKELLASDGSLVSSSIYIGGLYEKTGSNATKYILLGNQKIAQKDPSGTYFIHTDHLGSSNVLTDASGNQAQLLQYTPFGTVSRNEGPKDIEQKFTGQRLDPSTGLYFYNARYYDHTCGRFIQADTAPPDLLDPQSFNRYTYAANNPVKFIDPTGHFAWLAFIAIVASIISVTATVASFVFDGSTGHTFSQIAKISGIVAAVAGGLQLIGQGIQAAQSAANQKFLAQYGATLQEGLEQTQQALLSEGLSSTAASVEAVQIVETTAASATTLQTSLSGTSVVGVGGGAVIPEGAAGTGLGIARNALGQWTDLGKLYFKTGPDLSMKFGFVQRVANNRYLYPGSGAFGIPASSFKFPVLNATGKAFGAMSLGTHVGELQVAWQAGDALTVWQSGAMVISDTLGLASNLHPILAPFRAMPALSQSIDQFSKELGKALTYGSN